MEIFLFGVGQVGSALVKQIEQHSSPISFLGMANSKKHIFNANNASPLSLLSSLNDSGQEHSLEQLVSTLTSDNKPALVVDCTASDELPKYYLNFLSKGISLVVANKKGLASELKNFKSYVQSAKENHCHFCYETTVGAALPIVKTLQDIIATGDRLISIEAVLSGSLGYILSNLSTNSNFCDLVTEAKQKGFLEPDPRDDLCGLDVTRKVLILARTAGIDLELDQITTTPLANKECLEAESVDEALNALRSFNQIIEAELNKALNHSCKLSYVARLNKAPYTVGLEKISPQSPFYSLYGTDNMVVLTTERYKENPVIIRGPGAGPEITASGVFAEILRVCSV